MLLTGGVLSLEPSHSGNQSGTGMAGLGSSSERTDRGEQQASDRTVSR